MKKSIVSVVLAAAAAAALWTSVSRRYSRSRPPISRIFELRTYTTNPGKLDALHARFRDHTNKLFKKHGMQMIGYWTPADPPESENTLDLHAGFPQP